MPKHSPKSGTVWGVRELFLKEKVDDQVIAPRLSHFGLLLFQAIDNETDQFSVPSTQVDEDFVPDDYFLVLYHPFPQWAIFDNSSSLLLRNESRDSAKTANARLLKASN